MLILLPLEAATGALYKLTELLVASFNIESGENAPELLSVITDPLTTAIIEVEIRDAPSDPLLQICVDRTVESGTVLKHFQKQVSQFHHVMIKQHSFSYFEVLG